MEQDDAPPTQGHDTRAASPPRRPPPRPPPLPPEYLARFSVPHLEYSSPEPPPKGHWREAAFAALMLLVGAAFFVTMLSMAFR